MVRRGRIVALALLLCAIPCAKGWSLGVGIRCEGGAGYSAWKLLAMPYDVTYTSLRYQRNALYGFSFVVDTNTGGDSLFNYRCAVGVDRVTYRFGDPMDFWRIHITNSIGFSLLRGPWFRLWLGPQFRLFYLPGSEVTSISREYGVIGVQRTTVAYGFGHTVGVITGLNFIIGRRASICLELGGRYGNVFGRERRENSSAGMMAPHSLKRYLDERRTWFQSFEGEGFAAVAFMLRFNEGVPDDTESNLRSGVTP